MECVDVDEMHIALLRKALHARRPRCRHVLCMLRDLIFARKSCRYNSPWSVSPWG